MYGLESPWGGIDSGNGGLERPQAWLASLQNHYDDWTTPGWDDLGDWSGYELLLFFLPKSIAMFMQN